MDLAHYIRPAKYITTSRTAKKPREIYIADTGKISVHTVGAGRNVGNERRQQCSSTGQRLTRNGSEDGSIDGCRYLDEQGDFDTLRRPQEGRADATSLTITS